MESSTGSPDMTHHEHYVFHVFAPLSDLILGHLHTWELSVGHCHRNFHMIAHTHQGCSHEINGFKYKIIHLIIIIIRNIILFTPIISTILSEHEWLGFFLLNSFLMLDFNLCILIFTNTTQVIRWKKFIFHPHQIFLGQPPFEKNHFLLN